MWKKLTENASKWKTLGRVCVFIVVFCLCFSFVSTIFQPLWTPDNNFYSLRGFYQEPRNTLETVFLGASIVRNDINTMRLYENNGICAYNLGTANQPVPISYWWLVEAYNRHPNSLKTVFFDASLLRQDSDDSAYHRGFDNMRLSFNKIRAVWEYTDGDVNKMFNYLFPLVTYHTRWDELKIEDLEKVDQNLVDGTRGYMYMAGSVGSKAELGKGAVESSIRYDGATPKAFDQEALEYFDKMCRFCQEHDLKLVVIKTPTQNWWSALSVATEQLAEQYGLEYLDFNYAPLAEEIDYIHPLDSRDGSHLNYVAAYKLTDWLGNYLTEECNATDVRGQKRYAHMEKQLQLYQRKVGLFMDMDQTTNVADGIKTAIKTGETVIVSVNGAVCGKLTQELRNAIAETGLTKLAAIEPGQEYIGVVDAGQLVYEEACDPGSASPLHYESASQDGTRYWITCDQKQGTLTYQIDGQEYEPKNNGILVIVCDRKTGELLNNKNLYRTETIAYREVYTNNTVAEVKAAGETAEYKKGSLESRIQLYLKKQQLANNFSGTRLALAEGDFFGFLEQCGSDPNKVILIAARDEASTKLTKESRAYLRAAGLNNLANLGFRHSYVCVIDGGVVVTEKSSADQSITVEGECYNIISAGNKVGNNASIKVRGEEYSLNSRGLNIVVFDKNDELSTFAASIDTYSTGIIISDETKQKYSDAVELYDQSTKLKETYKGGNLFGFLADFLSDTDNMVLIVAKDEASSKLDAADRTALAQYGLVALAELGFRDPYVACLDANGVIFEQKGTPDQVVTCEDDAFNLYSAGYNAGNHTSIRINNREYSLNSRGLNLVVYNRARGEVVGQITFDSYAKEILDKEITQ